MKRKETYLSRDFRDTAAQCFPAQAKQLNAAFDILHTQNSACVCEISVIFFVFRYTLGLPQAPGLAGGHDYRNFSLWLWEMFCCLGVL